MAAVLDSEDKESCYRRGTEVVELTHLPWILWRFGYVQECEDFLVKESQEYRFLFRFFKLQFIFMLS